jgi:transposase
LVAHPGQLRLIFRSKRKHDRIDARKLAQLLLVNIVPPVYVPQRQVRAWRQMIEYRQALIAKRTRVKNSLRSLLRSVGVRAPARPGLWSQLGQRWLRGVEFSEALYALRRDLLCEELDHLSQQLARVERQLEVFSHDNASIVLLRTIPGIGLRTAEALVAYIDDPQRFRRSKSIGCYFGLVPSQDQSGSHNRLGHITSEGPASVRRLLAEAAWQSIRRSPTIAAYYERIRHDDPDRKKIALVATAHYLARVTLAMLRTGELWREREVA